MAQYSGMLYYVHENIVSVFMDVFRFLDGRFSVDAENRGLHDHINSLRNVVHRLVEELG